MFGDGIKISGTGGVAGLWVEHEHITGNAGYGINQTIPNPPYPASELQINNNIIEANTLGGINAEVLYASSITGNHFENLSGVGATLVKIGTLGFAQGLNISHNIFGGQAAQYNIDMNGAVSGVITGNHFLGASVAAIRANVAQELTVLNNTLTPDVPKVIEVGGTSRSVWVQDSNNTAYYAGVYVAPPNLRLDGLLQFSGTSGSFAALKGNGATLETRTADGSGYAQHVALSFKQAAGPAWTSGAGAPSGSCATGSLYTRTDGGAGSTLYVCQAGVWAAK